MSRLTIAVLTAMLALILADPALAQEALRAASGNGNPPDTFPAALGYAVVGVVSTAGTVMSGVIAKLWKAQRDQDKNHGKQIADLRADHRTAIQEVKDECRSHTDQMQARLETEQRERREEAERLLREQKEIMREVMVTCSAVSQSLEQNTAALVKLESMIQQWGEAE
jgi:hypothetical protein